MSDPRYKRCPVVFVFLFLTHFSWRENLLLHPCCSEWYLSASPRVIYVPHHLQPLICRWTFRWFPCLCCCDLCCYEHRSTSIFLNPLVSSSTSSSAKGWSIKSGPLEHASSMMCRPFCSGDWAASIGSRVAGFRAFCRSLSERALPPFLGHP